MGMGPVSDANVPQEPASPSMDMNSMPSTTPGGSTMPPQGPDPTADDGFDSSMMGAPNESTPLPGSQSALRMGLVMEAALEIREINPAVSMTESVALAIRANRYTAANPLGFGDRQTSDGPITRDIKHMLHRMVYPNQQRQQAPTTPIKPNRGAVPPAGPRRPDLTPGSNVPDALPAGGAQPGQGERQPAPAGPGGRGLLDRIPLHPHERRLLKGIQQKIMEHYQRHKDKQNAPVGPPPGFLPEDRPIPGDTTVQDVINSGQPKASPKANPAPKRNPAPAGGGKSPDMTEEMLRQMGIIPHDLNEDDQPGGRKKQAAGNPLDFGNRMPEPEGPIEQQAEQGVEKGLDELGQETTHSPGGDMLGGGNPLGGGKPSGGGAKPGGSGAGAAGEAGGAAGEAGAMGEVAEMAPLLAV
jgi:hypothetical protein